MYLITIDFMGGRNTVTLALLADFNVLCGFLDHFTNFLIALPSNKFRRENTPPAFQ